MDIVIAMIVDYLFGHPEISNSNLLRCFAKTRSEPTWDLTGPEFASEIACSLGLKDPQGAVSAGDRLKAAAMMMCIHNLISGEEFFCSMPGLGQKGYRYLAKETLKVMLIAAFVHGGGSGG